MRLLTIAAAPNESASCAPCGGRCCKTAPGIASPDDLGAPDEEAPTRNVKALLDTGRWAVDWWDGNPLRDGGVTPEQRAWAESVVDEGPYDVWFLRPAVQGSEGERTEASYGGPCTFHRQAGGCLLRFAERPHGCRALKPLVAPMNGCYAPSDDGFSIVEKVHYVLAWLPWQRALRAAVDGVIIVAEGG